MEKKIPYQDYISKTKQKFFKRELSPFSRPPYSSLGGKKFTFDEKTKLVIEGQSGKSSIKDICIREGITPLLFYNWSKEVLSTGIKEENSNVLLSDDERYRIVLEGSNGELSVAEICRRENITQDQYLQWSDDFLNIRNRRLKRERKKDEGTNKQKEKIIANAGEEVLLFFESYIDVTSENTLIFTNENLCFNNKIKNIDNVVCLQKVNNIRRINEYIEFINSKMVNGGVLMGCVETFTARRNRLKINNIPVINEIYFGGEFIVKRVFPKLNSYTKKIFFDITKGRDRLMSKAECLGRIVSSGFKIMDFKTINGLVYFVVKKVGEPERDKNPSYGLVYQMPRVGQNGKIIKVYKFRTMHPYSEYLQKYIVKANGYSDTGKPANDFRIPKWGKIMRMFWLDELPQLINVFKREMKLVGVRPLSIVRFKEIPKEMQKLRLPHKPGCIPPYIALNRESDVISLLQAEKDYIEEKMKHPKTTDVKFFFRAIFNIIFKHKRSA